MTDDEPDEALEEANRYLNARFYATSPTAYFRQRLNGVLLFAAGLDEYRADLLRGMKLFDMEFRVGPEEFVSTELQQAELRRYVVAETEILLHHMAECALRLYLAHEIQGDCPWSEIVSLPIGEFRPMLARRFDPSPSQEVRRRVAWTLVGLDSYDGKVVRIDEATWDRRLDAAVAWMRYLWQTFSSGSEFYNSAKHGFTALADEASMSVSDDTTDRTFLSASGPSIEYLRRSEWQDGKRHWSSRTVWVNPVHSWVVTGMAISIAEAIWVLGGHRYAGKPLAALFAPHCEPRDIDEDLAVSGVQHFDRPRFVELRQKRLPGGGTSP